VHMSRGFVKEGDQEDIPVVPPRAHLPDGTLNYVTQNGFEDLQQEQILLVNQRNDLIKESSEKNRIQINHINAKLHLLNGRIKSAKVVDITKQPKNEVHFGATVKLFEELEGSSPTYQIVGVDEADISRNKVSFLSPISKALLNKKVGDFIELKTRNGVRELEIIAVDYNNQ